jgi:uncharacterized membrane protein YfcA
MVTLKAYLLSLGPPTPELIKTLVTVLLGCWAWNMLFGRRRWSAKGKVRPPRRRPPALSVGPLL